jgi:hypothetical protein
MPPTGVPVETITHSGLEEWFVGTSSELPEGQLEGVGVVLFHDASEAPDIGVAAPDADKPANDASRRPDVTREARTESR